MSIAAQLAQGSTFFIAGTAGSAKTITGVSAGSPTIFTSSAHGLANGDYVTIAGLTGADAALFNSLSFPITNVTTNTFAIQVNSVGKTLTASGTATPAAWIQINQIKAIKPGGAQASKIDVTDLSSTAKEYRTGLIDNGTLSCDVFILESDPGQTACLAAFIASTVNTYKIVSPGPHTRTFSATCLKFPTVPDSAVDGVQTGSAEWQISGAVTVS